MNHVLIKEILQKKDFGEETCVYGWVKTKRDSKNLVFIQVNDGSTMKNLQLTFSKDEVKNPDLSKAVDKVTTGCCIKAVGKLVPSYGKGQEAELALEQLSVIGECDASEYPLQKKNMSMEYLRENAHLRGRTNTFQAVFRLRSRLSYAIHSFFNQKNFVYIHTPIITCSDAEGAGEMFQLTTLSLEELAKKNFNPNLSKNGSPLVDYKKDFFGKKAGLTVSGQLEAETLALALSRVYTFGPTFRAENSNTPRHLSEFWMIEPEMAFYDLTDNMDLQEEFLKYLLKFALTECEEDMAFFEKRIQNGIISSLTHVADTPFKRITYTEAVEILEKENENFEYKIKWGAELQTEHERFLTEKVFKAPVMVYNYPKEAKAFYMKQNDDGKTVRAVDVLVPSLGEITGGSQREDSLEKLEERCKELKMDMSIYKWYLDLRRFGSAPHSGFGLGFDRLVRYITGMNNIRDVIPYPRCPKSAEF